MNSPDAPPPQHGVPVGSAAPGAAVVPVRPRRGRAVARGLWRWTKRVVLALVVLVVVVRMALPYTLPGLLARLGRAHGLAIGYGDLRLALHRGEVSLTQLDVRPLPAEGADAGSAEPLLEVEFLDVDVDLTALLGGVVHVRRAVLDGVTARIEREADGRWQLQRFLPQGSGENVEEVEPSAPQARASRERGPSPIDFSAPVRVDAARLQHVKLVLVDRTVETPLDTELLLDVRLSDLGVPEREARLHVDARSKELLDRFRVEGTFRGALRALDAKLEVALDGLTPRPLAGMLGAIGIEPIADDVDARLRFTAHAEALEGSDVAVRATMRVDGVTLRADLQEALALDALDVEIPHFAGDRIDVAQIVVRGVRGAARRRVDGAFAIAGFAFLPGRSRVEAPAGPRPADAAAEASGATSDRGSASAPGDSAAPLVFTLGELLVENGALDFHDDSVAPPTEIASRLASLRLTGFVLDPARRDAEVVLALRGNAAGFADTLTLDVKARPFAAQRTFELRAVAAALDGAAIAPYLAPLGLAPDFAAGSATLALRGSVATDAEGALSVDVSSEGLSLLPDDGRPGFEVGDASVAGLTLAADGRTLRVGAVTLALERAEATRDELGVVRALGLRTLTPDERAAVPKQPVAAARHAAAAVAAAEGAGPTETAPAAPAAPEDAPDQTTPAAKGPAPAPMLRVEVASAKIDASALRVIDHFTPRPVDFAVSELALELRDLALGGDPARTGEDRGTISARFVADGVAGLLALDATLTSRPGPLDLTLELAVDGAGLVTRKIDPWLAELGVESTLVDGRLRLALRASAATTAEGTRVAASLTEVVFGDGERELLSLAALEVDEVLVGDGFTRVGQLTLRDPRLAVARDVDGGLSALGFRLPPRPEATATEPGAPPGTRPAAPRAAQPSAPEAPVGAAEPAAPRRFSLVKLAVDGVRLDWTDAWQSANGPSAPLDTDAANAASESGVPIRTALLLSGTLEDVRLGEAGPPARFDLGLGVEGALDTLRLAGVIDLAEEVRTLRAEVTGTGLRAGPLAAYLPPNLVVSLTDGRLAGQIELSQEPAAAGGQRFSAEVKGLSLREGEGGVALATLTRLRLDAPRIDPAARVVEIGELTTEGLALDVVRTGPTTYEALGVALTLAAPLEPVAEADAGPATEAAAPGEGPAVEARGVAGAETTPPVAAPRTLVVGLSGVANDDLPTLDIAQLSLGIDRLGFLDRTVTGAVPLELRAHLVLPRPTRFLGPDPETLAPLEVQLVGAAEPFVREATLRVLVSPFAPLVHLEAEVDVRGISGPGLASVVPDLEQRLDLAGLVDGRISGKLDATFDAQRRGPAAFDLSRGIGAVLEFNDLGVRASEGGEVLLGVERIFVDAPRLRPLDGDYSVRTIEVTRPILRARKTPAGLELLGVVVRDAPPATAGSGRSDGQPAGPSTGAAPPDAPESIDAVAAAREPEPSDGPFTSIDELLVSGVDLRYEDTSVTPAMVVPMTDLDVEVRGLSTRGGGAVTLRAYVESGPVTLPERVQGDGLMAGLVSAAAGAVTGRTDTFKTELRPLWETLAVTGRVAVGPGPPTGHVTLDLEGFELQSMRGLARASGVEISDGLIEAHATVRLLGEEGLRLETRTIFSHLFVSEPPGGPISKYLALPAPLDSVLFVLRDKDEQQDIPLTVDIPPDGMSAGNILGIVTVTLGQLIASAVASSPLRIGTGALGAIGLLGLLREEAAPPLGAPFVVSFEALDGALDERSERVLADVAADVRKVPERKLRLVHELGGGDVEAAVAAMHLAPLSLADLGEVLLGTRESLGAEREALAAAVRSNLAVGRLTAAEEARLELIEIEERAAETETALDQVFGLMRSGVPPNYARRARAAAIMVGEARLGAVQRALVRAGFPPERIEVRRPRSGRGIGTGGGRVLVEQR